LGASGAALGLVFLFLGKGAYVEGAAVKRGIQDTVPAFFINITIVATAYGKRRYQTGLVYIENGAK